MPRFHNINGTNVQFTAAEETARDNEEAAVLASKSIRKFKTKKRWSFKSV